MARSLESIKPNEKPFPSLGETFAKPRANLHVEEEDLNLQIENCGFFPGNCIYLKSFEVASRAWFCRREKSRGEWNSIVDHGICLRGLIKTYAQVGSSPERESTWPPTFRNWTKFLASKVSAASIDQRWWRDQKISSLRPETNWRPERDRRPIWPCTRKKFKIKRISK